MNFERTIGRQGETSLDPLADLAERILVSPEFPLAAEEFTRSMNRFRREGPRQINKLLGRDIRFRVVNLCFCLHVRGLLVGPEKGATFLQLVDATARTLGGSARVVRTTLEMMVQMGLVTVASGETDLRTRVYLPTAGLMAMVRAWLAGVMGQIDILDPAGRRLERFAADDGIVEQTALNMAHAFLEGESLTGRVPELSCFFQHDSGWPVLNTVIAHTSEGTTIPTLGVIAETFGLTKSQVANVVGKAVDRGLLVRDGTRTLLATPDLVAANRRWIAVFLAFLMRASTPDGRIDDRVAAEAFAARRAGA